MRIKPKEITMNEIELPSYGIELDLENIDKEYGLKIEDSTSTPMTEYDYETMQPMGETYEMVATISFKIGEELNKLGIDLSNLIKIYKKAKRKKINISIAENYHHQTKVGQNSMAQNPGFNILDYVKKCISKEKQTTDFMFG